MRMLVVSDLHYDLKQLDWVLGEAADHDLVVVVGDLLDVASAVPLEAQVPVVVGYIRRLADRCPTIVCSGNHDLTGRDADGEKAALWIDQAAAAGALVDFGSTWLGDTLVTVCPWWDGPKGRARVDTFLAEQATLARDRWIWVYHWPPPDLPVSWIGSKSYGDPDLAGWIERHHPTLVITGHVHQAPFTAEGSWVAETGGTWVVNAGRQPGPQPTSIVIDLDDWTARWWSYEETGEQLLAPA